MKRVYSFLLLCLSFHCLYSQTNPTETDFIVVDQFGYLPESQKIAFIRNPQTGYDAGESFTPGSTFAVINNSSLEQVYTGASTAWNGGTEDASSGDIVWRFDFSPVTTQGEYYILDIENNVKSYAFSIQNNIYKDVLIQAFKSFYYQRAGFAKETPYAGAGWTDGASHIGNLQDTQCRKWDATNDASTEKDVHGGWFDAGDFNKYTSWTAEYIMQMLLMYEENPDAWTDDFEIPESGNGIPDILDEARFGLEHLLRLQFDNGSCISVIGVGHASPPSSATGQSRWGDASTSATLACAGAYAYGAKVFENIGDATFATTLQTAAINAWNWAESNPSVLFYNNDATHGTSGLAAGQQEVDDYGRLTKKLNAAMHLYEITGDNTYNSFFESNYSQVHLLQWTFAYPFETIEQDMLLYYTRMQNASSNIAAEIKNTYTSAMNSEFQLQAIENETDPYLAYLKDYTWGSNNIRMRQGNMFYDYITYELNSNLNSQLAAASENYIHYIHGANPLNKCYLSNMSAWGAENSVSEFYHTWFADGSTLWDNTETSAYGPAPGFLVGGPNPSYDWDGCCPDGCGSTGNNARCYELNIEPPKNQPKQKSYKDFNNGWPLNSWAVTENSCGYQVSYLRLLSKFVTSDAQTTTTQTIDLSSGWNLISFYIEPENNAISALLPVTYCIKTQNGFFSTDNISWLNSLDTIAGGTGYLINVETDQTISQTGEPVLAQNIQLKTGWNLIGIPKSDQRDIATIIAPISSNIEVIKNFEGYFEPGNNLSNITDFIPGKAYFVKVNSDCELTWE